jgi:iron complex outermembrane recepter protein
MKPKKSPRKYAFLTSACTLTTALIAAPTTAVSQAQSEDRAGAFRMEEIVVTGTASPQRTKFDSSYPISTFGSDAIERKAPMSTADMLSEVPGFWVEATSGTTQGNVFARGITQDGGYRYLSLQEDGMPVYPVGELSFFNPDQFVRVDAFVDRVEAVRGGTAGIFATGAAGGIINFVTRSPGLDPEVMARLTGSDYGMVRADAYVTAPISDQWGIAAGGYFRTSDGVRDPGYTADEGGHVHVKLFGDFGDLRLELFGRYLDDTSLFVVPIPLAGSSSSPREFTGQDAGTYSLHSSDLAAAGLPPSADNVGVRGQDLRDGINPELLTAGGRVTWDINDRVTFTNAFRFTDADVTFNGIFPGPAPVSGFEAAADPGLLGCNPGGVSGLAPEFTVISAGAAYDPSRLVQCHGHWAVAKDYFAIQNDARLNFDFGEHFATLGFYVANFTMEDRWSLGNLLLMTIDDRPQRLSLPGLTDPDGFARYSFFNLLTDHEADTFGLYVANEWQATDAARFDVGVRYDRTELDVRVSEFEFGVDLDGDPDTPWDNDTALVVPGVFNRSDLDFDEWQFTVGLNYDVAPNHGLFARYTTVYKLPHFDDVRDLGENVSPDNIEHFEAGYKVMNDFISAFVTLFQTEMDSVFLDILADGTTASRGTETRSRGIEIEGSLLPLAGLNRLGGTDFQRPALLDIGFSMTFQDPEIIASGPDRGNQTRRIPKTMVRLTPTLYLMAERLRLYGTWSHVGKRFANPENTVPLPSYDKIDLGIIYEHNDNWSFQITADNVTDELGLTEGNPRTDLGVGAPVGSTFMARPLFGRSFRASVSYQM